MSNIEEDGRILIETQSSHLESQKGTSFPSQVTVLESVLKFKQLIAADNGSYICKADSAIPFEKPLLTNFHVWVLEIPQVKIIKINENKTEAIVTFTVDYGNLPVEKYFLEIRNYTIANSSWTAHNVQANSVTIEGANSVARVDGLTPGALYGFRLAAKNEVGTSEWSNMNITVPPDGKHHLPNVRVSNYLSTFCSSICDNAASLAVQERHLTTFWLATTTVRQWWHHPPVPDELERPLCGHGCQPDAGH